MSNQWLRAYWEEGDSKTIELAVQVISAKFGGLVPETVTARECIDLMRKFAEYESFLARNFEKLAVDILNCMPAHPAVINKSEGNS